MELDALSVSADHVNLQGSVGLTIPNHIHQDASIALRADFGDGSLSASASSKAVNLSPIQQFYITDRVRSSIPWTAPGIPPIRATLHAFPGAVESYYRVFSACPGDNVLASTCPFGNCVCDGRVQLDLFDGLNGSLLIQGDDNSGGCSEILWKVKSSQCKQYSVKAVCTSTLPCINHDFRVGFVEDADILPSPDAAIDYSYSSDYSFELFCPYFNHVGDAVSSPGMDIVQRCRFRGCGGEAFNVFTTLDPELPNSGYCWSPTSPIALAILDMDGEDVPYSYQSHRPYGSDMPVCPTNSFEIAADSKCQDYTAVIECNSNEGCSGQISINKKSVIALKGNAVTSCPHFSIQYFRGIDLYYNNYRTCSFEVCPADVITVGCHRGSCDPNVFFRVRAVSQDLIGAEQYFGNVNTPVHLDFTGASGCMEVLVKQGCVGFETCDGTLFVNLTRSAGAQPVLHPTMRPSPAHSPDVPTVNAVTVHPTFARAVPEAFIVPASEYVYCPRCSTSDTDWATRNTAKCTFRACLGQSFDFSLCDPSNAYRDMLVRVTLGEHRLLLLQAVEHAYGSDCSNDNYRPFVAYLEGCVNVTIEAGCKDDYACSGQVGVRMTGFGVSSPILEIHSHVDLPYNESVSCPYYTAANSMYGSQFYSTCSFELCDGDSLDVTINRDDYSNFPCEGGVYLSLYDDSSSFLTSSNELDYFMSNYVGCYASEFQCTHRGGCTNVTLREGCWENRACRGQVQLFKLPRDEIEDVSELSNVIALEYDQWATCPYARTRLTSSVVQKNYVSCYFEVCSGDTVEVTACGQCNPEPFAHLYANGSILARTDSDCSNYCRNAEYSHYGVGCSLLELRRGCYSYGLCYNYNSVLKTLKPIAPSELPTLQPTFYPTKSPSGAPTYFPTTVATMTAPTRVPSSGNPIARPSFRPTFSPTVKPSRSPSLLPTVLATVLPTKLPSLSPTLIPSKGRTVSPSTSLPSVKPTRPPSFEPTFKRTREPTEMPTKRTKLPSLKPTRGSTEIPSQEPSPLPSAKPSKVPTLAPTSMPPSIAPISAAPSLAPTTETVSSISPSIATPTIAPSLSGIPKTKRPSMIPSRSPVHTIRPTRRPTKAGKD